MLNQKILIIKAVLNRIEIIEEYLKNFSKKEFSKDKKTIDAVKANIIDIGQALKDIQKKHKEIISDEELIVIKLRNETTHIYWKNRVNEIWEVSKIILPKIKEKYENKYTEEKSK